MTKSEVKKLIKDYHTSKQFNKRVIANAKLKENGFSIKNNNFPLCALFKGDKKIAFYTVVKDKERLSGWKWLEA